MTLAPRSALRAVAAAALLLAAAAPVRAQATAAHNEPDTQPVLATRNLPQLTNAAYPQHLRAHPYAGNVAVRMRILETGRVDSLSVSVATSSDPAFDEAARTVALRLRFRPAMLAGQAVPVWVTYPINFAPWTDGTSTVTRRIPNPR